MLITNSGNLLRHCDLGWYFCKPSGEFLREATQQEADFLSTQCAEIDMHFPPEHPYFFPKWEFVTSVRTLADYRSFKPETSSNGGNYAFYEGEDWFVAVLPDGLPVFRYVHTYSTSAEFDYDDFTGKFQRTEILKVANALRAYATQKGGTAVLEQISQVGEFPYLWNASCETLLDYEGDRSTSYLSFSEKKEIISKLKELGIQKDGKRTRRRHSSLKITRR